MGFWSVLGSRLGVQSLSGSLFGRGRVELGVYLEQYREGSGAQAPG